MRKDDIDWQCIRENGLTLDESFVWWKLQGKSVQEMAEQFVHLTRNDEKPKDLKGAIGTLRNKIKNHEFYTEGIRNNRENFSEGHHKACVRYNVILHPDARAWAIENRRWGQREFYNGQENPFDVF